MRGATGSPVSNNVTINICTMIIILQGEPGRDGRDGDPGAPGQAVRRVMMDHVIIYVNRVMLVREEEKVKLAGQA